MFLPFLLEFSSSGGDAGPTGPFAPSFILLAGFPPIPQYISCGSIFGWISQGSISSRFLDNFLEPGSRRLQFSHSIYMVTLASICKFTLVSIFKVIFTSILGHCGWPNFSILRNFRGERMRTFDRRRRTFQSRLLRQSAILRRFRNFCRIFQHVLRSFLHR